MSHQRPAPPEPARAPQAVRVWPTVIADAHASAHAKHGQRSILALPAADPAWLPILVEEVGEVATALTYDGPGNLREELVDVIAVAAAWLDALEREGGA